MAQHQRIAASARSGSPPLRGAVALLCLLLLLAAALAGEKPGPKVVVHLTSGAKMEARLVAEDKDSLTLATGEGTVRLPRSLIARIERPGESPKPQGKKPIVTSSRVEVAPPREMAPLPPKPEQWTDAEEARIEALLDRYFAAPDEAARKAVAADLAKTKLQRRFDDLERMRKQALGKKGLLRHVPVPWRSGAKRGWYNIAIPRDYTPTRAWPLVLALHGMPSDGDNLISHYGRYFPQRGTIVLFPTTLHRSSFWPAPNEKRELLRLVRHVSELYRIDYRRIYCTGASGGGIGTWHWLATLPELFAGAISFSAMGTIFDKRLEKLTGTPFYVHHGTKDYIPIGSVRKAVEAARRFGAQIEFHISEGTGHTPPWKDWQRAFDWLCKVPPSQVSPRYLLESGNGALPVGYPRYLPFAVTPEREALAAIHAATKDVVPRWAIPSRLPSGDLLEGLIAVARILDPACDAERIRTRIRQIADAVRKKLDAKATPEETLYALSDVFFHAEGFARDPADPSGQKPEGYAVHLVLDRRRGSVFTLTGIYVAVAGKLALPVFPVVTPYHAFARFDDGAEQVNVEMTESGGHFDDAIYTTGYGMSRMPPAATLKSKATPQLLAAHLAALGAMARTAKRMDKAADAARTALALDPACFGALMLQALAARDEHRTQDALSALRRAVGAWPTHAAPRLVQGELELAAGSRQRAVDAYKRGAAAPIKPHGAEGAWNAEFHYRIAAIYAPLARAALAARNPAAVRYQKEFNKAIIECLRYNPRHPAARKLIVEMGGSVR